MFLFSIFCHHTFWLHWESGRKKEALAPFICWLDTVYGGICFVPNSMVGTLRDKDISEASCPLRTHKDRGNTDVNTKYRETVTSLKCINRTSCYFLLPFISPCLLCSFLPSLPKMSYSTCLLARQLRGDPLVICGDECTPWIMYMKTTVF